mmetsp:Transcript_1574/g.3662  ORF Transcript_1574/g.3662 Transcript_1574/m.3662 type:complete len:295 (+) Transcript_1574:257-1141(+)
MIKSLTTTSCIYFPYSQGSSEHFGSFFVYNVCSASSCLERKVLKNGLSVNKLLDAHTGSGEHGKTSVGQFLGLHVGELLRIGGLQSKRIESDITGVVVLSEGEEFSHSRFNPSLVGSESFRNVDDEEEGEHNTEERNFRDHVVGNGRVVESVGDGRGVFADEVSDGGHHSNTSVHDFCLTESLDSGEVTVGGESHRIEESEGGDSSGKSEAWKGGIRSPSVESRSKRRWGRRLDLNRFRGHVGGLEGGGSSRGGDRSKSRDGRGGGSGQDHAGRELHFDCICLSCYKSFKVCRF